MSDEPKTKTEEAVGLNLDLQEATSDNVPAVVQAEPVKTAGGLSYDTARPDEKARMDQIIEGIDLTDPETVVSLGGQERQKLADVAEQMLDSFKPDAKLAFAEALKSLLDTIMQNNVDAVRKRSTVGALKRAFKMVACMLTGKDYRVELNKDMVASFMEDVTGSRATIQEVTDTLEEQYEELNKNFNRINTLGKEIVVAAQDMRVVRAATAEYIRRVDAGEITTLTDLETTANTSGRSDDTETLQLAQATWNNLRTVDGDLLASISVYDMNVANLAFTKQANIQNRMKTSTALTSTTAEWKTQLAVFGTVLVERAAQSVLDTVGDLTDKSVQANQDLFEELVDSTIKQATNGMYDLKKIKATQDKMASKLEEVGPAIEAQFNVLAADKAALEQSAAEFRERAGKVYSNKGGILSQPKP